MSKHRNFVARAKRTASRHPWDDTFSEPVIIVSGNEKEVMIDVGPGIAFMPLWSAREFADKLGQVVDDMEGRERAAESDTAAGHTIESAEVCEVNGTAWVPEDKIAVTVLVPDSYAPHIGLGTNTTLTIHPQDGGQA